MIKILICDPIADEAISKLKELKFQVDVKTNLPEPELIKTIPEYDAIVVRSATKVTKPVIESGKNLKLIVRGGVGTDNIDIETADKFKIKVVNTPGATSISVAELTLGLIFAIYRKIHQADNSMKSAQWEKKKFQGTELFGKTIGIIGIGRIGKEVASRALALGMKVITYDPYVRKEDLPENLSKHIDFVSFNELLEKADIVSLHLPLTEETKHLIGKPEFDKMRTNAVLINCSRGGIIDEDALATALTEGKILGAAVDVFEKEPLPKEHPFLRCKNIILTPHIGASTQEGQYRVGLEVVDKIVEFFK
jgi:D-3-phosphoglycerate dehydrogenase